MQASRPCGPHPPTCLRVPFLRKVGRVTRVSGFAVIEHICAVGNRQRQRRVLFRYGFWLWPPRPSKSGNPSSAASCRAANRKCSQSEMLAIPRPLCAYLGLTRSRWHCTIESLKIAATEVCANARRPRQPEASGERWYLQSRVGCSDYIGDTSTHASGALRISGLRLLLAEPATSSRVQRPPARPQQFRSRRLFASPKFPGTSRPKARRSAKVRRSD